MTKLKFVAALLGSTALFVATPALAQDPLPEAQQQPTDPDVSDTAADEAIAQAAPVDASQAQIELLQAQVEALQEALEGVKAAMVQTTPSWKGAPQFSGEGGWTFKPRGRLQYDAGWVSNPDNAIATRNLGFNTRARRIRLGAEGTIPGDFGYKFEMDFADSQVRFGDAILTYAPKGRPFSFAVGNHDTFQTLERLTSSRFTSFMERAQMNDAFNHERRIGVSLGLQNKPGDLRFNAGVFAAHSIDSTFNDNGWIGAARATYSPQAMGGQLHLGANFQHRQFSDNNSGADSTAINAPSNNQRARYRARPFVTTTDVRFVDTNTFAAKSDDIWGVELAGIFKSLHFAGEAQWTRVNSYRAGETIVDPLNMFPGNSQFVPDGNPSFFSAYGELGYFLTGETRGYKPGAWDRTKVLNPFSKGGSGAVQLVGRIDYLDLDSDKLKNGCTNNFATGVCTASSSSLSRGGTQLGFLAGLTWIPEDYVRVLVNYAHGEITGGPFAATVDPTSSEPVDERKYGVDVVATRLQIDF